MDFGMLWLDDDSKRPFEEKVKRAAEYYRGKYGRKPNFCLVNQKSLKETKSLGKISIVPDQSILPNHFLIGLKSI
ncbi:MAG: hypothetical protein AAF490_13895 [Chloroflexota bacterium]